MNPVDKSNHQEPPKTPVDLASFQHRPGETPRAYSAFMAFFQLGHDRSLQAVADRCDVSIDTIKKWSSRFDWKGRIQSFNTGILQEQAAIEATVQREQAAQWSARMAALREQQWIAAQKLLEVVQCYLESFGDEQLEKMTLSQVSRALVVASRIGRMALSGCELPLQTESPLPQIRSGDNPPKPLDVVAELPHNAGTPCIDPTNPELDAPVAENCENLFSVTESAEKCRSESNSEGSPTSCRQSLASTPVPVDSRPSTVPFPVPSCPSRGLARTQKIIFKAQKCRKVQFSITQRNPLDSSPFDRPRGHRGRRLNHDPRLWFDPLLRAPAPNPSHAKNYFSAKECRKVPSISLSFAP